MSAITLATLNKFKAERKRFSMVTAYDASFAAAAARAGVASVLVGDSLGMVVQGGASTVSVTLEDMAYHTACVARGIAPCGAAAPLIVLATFEGCTENVAERCAGVGRAELCRRLPSLRRFPAP
jgi:3-methyl-2-oxobutanoate hydroxymethyltransferase